MPGMVRATHWLLLAGMIIGLLLSAPSWADDKQPNPSPQQILQGHGGPVRTLVMSGDGNQLASGGFDNAMLIWQRDDNGHFQLLKRFDDHDAAVNAVIFIPGTSKILSAGDDGLVRLWDIASGTLEHIFKGHKHKVTALALSPNGKFFASASWDRSVKIWSLVDHKLHASLEGHGNVVNGVAFSTSGDQIFTACADGIIRQYNMAGGLQRELYRHGWGINVLAVLPFANQLVFGTVDGTGAVLDLDSGEIVDTLVKRERPILSVAILAPEKLIALGGGDGIVSVHDMASHRPIGLLDNPYGPIWALAFNVDSNGLYMGGLDDVIHYWQFRPGAGFEPVRGEFPRRFQRGEGLPLGARQFARKCSLCHTLTADSGNRAGPSLYKIIGRKAGTLAGYSYSNSLKNSDVVWNEQTISDLFAQGPQHFIPGTKMPLQKMTNPEELAALVTFLKNNSDDHHNNGNQSHD